MTVLAMAETKPRVNGHKVKITGPIVVLDGDTVEIVNEKDGSVHGFKITDETTIRCEKGFLHGKTVMRSSALVPALTIEVEGRRTLQGIPEATAIKVSPDIYALRVDRDRQGGDLCPKPVQDDGRYHGIRTLFSSLLPPI